MLIVERGLSMKITEKKLRNVIRGVLKEQEEFDRFNIQPGEFNDLNHPSNKEFKEYIVASINERIKHCDELLSILNREIRFHNMISRDMRIRLGVGGSLGEELSSAVSIVEDVKRRCESLL